MRTFIAIELPEETKDSLAEIQNQLKKTGADVKWVEPKNIHLTLKFLGERDEKKIKEITRLLDEAAVGRKQFIVRISSVGAFPKIDYPRVIWVAIDKGDVEVKQIAEDLEEKIAKAGIPKEERPFSSHITIGRIKSNLNKEGLVDRLKNLDYDFNQQSLQFTVTKLTLFKSTLTPKGPIYEAIKETNLNTH